MLLLISTFGLAASAQTTKASLAEAAKHFQSGVDLYREHDFKGALAEFERAHQIAPNASVLYNIGQAQYELKDYGAALDSFQHYLDEGKPSKARRTEVTATITALKARIATVEIKCNVDDADVLIGDAQIGKTPLPSPISVNVGEIKITVSHEGYPSVDRVVQIAGGDALQIEIDLVKPPAPIVIVRPVVAPPSEPPPEDLSRSNVVERPGKTYYFVGARYRGTILPKFVLNAFVDEGKTIYQNSAGIELDIRKDGFSLIPALSYVEYGTGDTLFLQKGKDASNAGNWSNVNSSLKAVYITADLLWSLKVNKYVDFEYGAGFGLGVLFGSLETSWVYSNPNGPYQSSNGARYSPCLSQNDAPSCTTAAHSNSTVAKVNHYTEPFWSNGGSTPNVFIHLAVPQLGVRIKPIRQMEGRIGLGLSLTGFFFGISGDYGLPVKH